eukprot:TRINITY_DN6753_c0_g1_i1.p1 TRINITY_DN6753_c0_g1~~TRINITY_DN6753_c0_g1_i1.p1  ORF type:complete len:245 (-),score=9.65 TRINITY_DN6753_c0_g1_i1:86-760(-)
MCALLVCKTWYHLGTSEYVWRDRLVSRFGAKATRAGPDRSAVELYNALTYSKLSPLGLIAKNYIGRNHTAAERPSKRVRKFNEVSPFYVLNFTSGFKDKGWAAIYAKATFFPQVLECRCVDRLQVIGRTIAKTSGKHCVRWRVLLLPHFNSELFFSVEVDGEEVVASRWGSSKDLEGAPRREWFSLHLQDVEVKKGASVTFHMNQWDERDKSGGLFIRYRHYLP